MTLDLRDTMQAEAYLLGEYEPELVRYISKRLAGDGLFVDVGANIGLIALPVAVANPGVRVVAFEPHPDNARALRENIASNPGTRVDVREIALGAEPGHVHLTTDDERESGWFRVSNLGDGVEVRMDTLDRALGDVRIDVMKIDAEGSEPAILCGAQQLLRAHSIRCLVTEVNPGHNVSSDSVAEYVAGFGYHRAPVPVPVGRRLRRLGVDEAVFVPR